MPGEGGSMELYAMPPGVESRWVSFENPNAAKGQGAQANAGAKGAAFDKVEGGETKTLLDFQGAGVIHRMWCTLENRGPEMLRSLRLRFYWDQSPTPAVDVPLGDFMGAMLGETTAFESALYSSPEAKSFNLYIPMPFRSGARVTLTNESNLVLEKFFYDINFSVLPAFPEDALYFHATWRRERWTALDRDFRILPKVSGRGRYLGAHVGVIGHPDNLGWWGEGEVKMYLDGDSEYPSIVGTGTEDYIGTGWGQGAFNHQFQGCLVSDAKRCHYTFYRYHVPDPVYFQEDIEVAIQQIGGAPKKLVIQMLDKGVPVKPISVNPDGEFIPLLEGDTPRDVRDPSLPDGWTNYYRRDDYCAVALFYLDKPENGLPELAPVAQRVEGL